jgi:plasmid stabilization system protein ParE
MAAELIWSDESLDDIDAIAEFIARDSLHHAGRVVESNRRQEVRTDRIHVLAVLHGRRLLESIGGRFE